MRILGVFSVLMLHLKYDSKANANKKQSFNIIVFCEHSTLFNYPTLVPKKIFITLFSIHFLDSGVRYTTTITTFSNLYDGNTVCTVFTNNNNVDRLFCICICFDFVYRVVSIKSNIYFLATSFRIPLCACACTVECT